MSLKKKKAVTIAERDDRAVAILMLYVVCIGFMAGLALSPNLWLSDRVFPHAPVFEWLTPWPQMLQIVLYAGMFVCLVLLMWRPSLRGAVFGIVGLWLLMMAQDQMRLQPWGYQYVLMLLPFAWIGRKGEHAAAIVWIARIIMVSLYFWGGLHKLGSQFVNFYENTLMASWLENSSGVAHAVLKSGAVSIPWIETFMAVLLVFPKTRRVGVVLAWGMHLVILVWLGPLGENINSVIWPWNMAMMIVVSVLFWKDSRPLLSLKMFVMAPKALKWTAVAIVGLAGVMPAFSIVGKWDRYLSFHLYSGHQQRVILALNASGVAKLDERCRPFLIEKRFFGEMSELELMPWAMQEMNVPFVSEDRIALQIVKTLLDRFDLNDGDAFVYRDFPMRTDTFTMEVIRPSQIRSMEKMDRLKRISGK